MKGKTALVTGAGRGIGRGIAEYLAGDGWTVAVNYRTNEASAAETLESVKRRGGGGFIVQADIADLTTHEKLVGRVMDKTGRIDLLVNNAGTAPRQRVDMLETSPESYDHVLATNLRGPFFLSQRVAKVMIQLLEKNAIESPKIINITSLSAVTASITRAEYCLSKAGLSMTTSLWAVRLADYGINVYEIRPGIIETDMTAGVKEKYDRLIAEGSSLIRRWGQPEDIGKAVSAIAGGTLGFSTGEVINVDGGFHVRRL